MSYQVLARKWRPRNFASLVGQEHVVRALTHALEQQRLHHAYLFTGTRGVGKTTIARILDKALNCETGISWLLQNRRIALVPAQRQRRVAARDREREQFDGSGGA